jgi:isoamylase
LPACGDGSVAENVGRSAPLGATVRSDGVNFSVFSRSAVAIELLLFDGGDDERPARVIQLDAATHRTYHYWHVFVAGLRAGQLYGYRVYVPLIRPKACDSIPTSYS